MSSKLSVSPVQYGISFPFVTLRSLIFLLSHTFFIFSLPFYSSFIRLFFTLQIFEYHVLPILLVYLLSNVSSEAVFLAYFSHSWKVIDSLIKKKNYVSCVSCFSVSLVALPCNLLRLTEDEYL